MFILCFCFFLTPAFFYFLFSPLHFLFLPLFFILTPALFLFLPLHFFHYSFSPLLFIFTPAFFIIFSHPCIVDNSIDPLLPRGQVVLDEVQRDAHLALKMFEFHTRLLGRPSNKGVFSFIVLFNAIKKYLNSQILWLDFFNVIYKDFVTYMFFPSNIHVNKSQMTTGLENIIFCHLSC